MEEWTLSWPFKWFSLLTWWLSLLVLLHLKQRSSKESCPRQLRKFLAVIFFYGGALLAIMSIIPWRELSATDSPFVTVFELVGLQWQQPLINCCLTSLRQPWIQPFTQQVVTCTNCPWFTKSFLRKLLRQIHFHATTFLRMLSCFCGDDWFLQPSSMYFLAYQMPLLWLQLLHRGVYIAIILIMVAHLKYRKSKDFMADGYHANIRLLNPLTILFFICIWNSL